MQRLYEGSNKDDVFTTLFLLILLLKVSLLPKVEVFLNLWYLKYCNLSEKPGIKKFLLTKSGC